MSGTTIPFFGVSRMMAVHRSEIMDCVEGTLLAGQVLQGAAVATFEGSVAALSCRKYGVAVNSCTDALYFALIATGVNPGNEVLVTNFTFIASASCIARLGAVPVFVDVDHTYNMDLDKAALMLTPKTKAIIFVHLYGQMGQPDQIEAFAREHDLILVEDAAQSIGATFDGRPAGSMGQVSCISFDPTKPISAPGSGGIVLTDDLDLAEHVRRLRYHGKSAGGEFVEIGYNSQMPTVTAAVLNWQLDHNAEWMERRRMIAQYYVERLSGLDLVLPTEHASAVHIYHKFVLRSLCRDNLKVRLAERGIQTMVHYSQPLHRQPCFAQWDYDDHYYPTSLSYADSVLSLPIHPFLSDAEVEHVVSEIRSLCLRM